MGQDSELWDQPGQAWLQYEPMSLWPWASFLDQTSVCLHENGDKGGRSMVTGLARGGAAPPCLSQMGAPLGKLPDRRFRSGQPREEAQSLGDSGSPPAAPASRGPRLAQSTSPAFSW